MIAATLCVLMISSSRSLVRVYRAGSPHLCISLCVPPHPLIPCSLPRSCNQGRSPRSSSTCNHSQDGSYPPLPRPRGVCRFGHLYRAHRPPSQVRHDSHPVRRKGSRSAEAHLQLPRFQRYPRQVQVIYQEGRYLLAHYHLWQLWLPLLLCYSKADHGPEPGLRFIRLLIPSHLLG